MCLPHQAVETDELDDPSFGEAGQVHRRAKVQAAILRDFQRRWRHEYLTLLREFHRASGNNNRAIREGDVVIVHGDTPCATWKMAVVNKLIVGRDELVRAATIRTTTGLTNRPITKLYPLELNEKEAVPDQQGETVSSVQHPTNPPPDIAEETSRPQRASAIRATSRVKEWARILVAPPEDVVANEH